ncbi:SurA N-terminal domain-containing protein [Alteromonas lipotrueiana]|uniref:SurA N-terminal domain-containing protein n=1 Tax=Alteromonas lipotrueiana TaxID=2803815 RepID=UPI001C4906C9|nr:SurA N-terminal domain-containing protein [Alteromonas lipotrueiana]
MLERIREGSQGPWAMIVIGLVVLSFVFAGVGSYLNSSGPTAVATVNGDEIDQSTLERAYQNQRARMESEYGESVSAMFADENYLKDFRRNVLERLINDKLIEQEALELGLRVGDKQIRETIRDMQEFQTAGQFDNERYLAILRQSGFQPSDFRDYLRTEMTRTQLAQALGAASFALPGEVERAWQLQSQTRDGRYVVVPSAKFAESVEITEQDIKNYYESNITAFDTQEEVNIAFVTLSIDDLTDEVNVSEQDIEQYYQENKDSYREEEERRVSHILIEFGDDKDAARQKAQSIKAELTEGADFAELAESRSDDTFSAENGGDLDFINRDMMDPAFDEAAFALEQNGAVSDVVETEFGFHIIKLTDIKPEQVTSLAEVKDDIRDRLQTARATERFYEIRSRMEEVAFEVPESLEDVAGVADQPIEETGMFTEQKVPAPIDNPNAASRAFSPELVEDRMNSEVIELDDSTVMVMRVKEHEPQRTRPLAEVSQSISKQLQVQKAQQAALNWAQSLVQKYTAGEDVDALLSEHDLAWQQANGINRGPGDLPRSMVETLFTLSGQEGNSAQATKLANGDVGIVELTDVQQPEAPDEQLAASLRQQLGSAYGQTLFQSYIDALRSEAEVEILQP